MVKKANGKIASVVVLAVVLLSGQHPLVAQVKAGEAEIVLDRGWRIQSSCQAQEGGEVISATSFTPHNWYPATVPGTVVSNLVADKVSDYPDPYVGMNLRKMPGMDYPIGGEFANLPMAESSPFRCSWWYRTAFAMPAAGKEEQSWLNLRGVNYHANVWLNGKQIADAKQIAGAFRAFELNVTSDLRYGNLNALAVEVFAPSENDLGITFVDWNPTPPDKNMGLWREAFIASTGPVALRHPFVDTKLSGDGQNAADLTIYADVTNGSQKPVKGLLEVVIEKTAVTQEVDLLPGETKEVSFAPEA